MERADRPGLGARRLDRRLQAIRVNVTNSAINDRMDFWDAANTMRLNLVLSATDLRLGRNYVTANTAFNATMVRSGNTITVTLGSMISGTPRDRDGRDDHLAPVGGRARHERQGQLDHAGHRERRCGPGLLMRGLLPLLASLGMALSALGLAFASPAEDRREPAAMRLLSGSGDITIVNSREGLAVLGAVGMRPGDQLSGTVRIGNPGVLGGRLMLGRGAVVDVPGAGGGKVSDALLLRVTDITVPTAPATLYDGPLAGFGELAAGTIAGGGAREYEFAATFALPAGDPNRFQGSAMTLGLLWGATAIDAPATPTPTPTPTATPTATPPRRGDATPTPTPTVALADRLGLPRAGTCVRAKTMRFKLRAPYGGRVLTATVAVNRKTKVKGRKALKAITLRKLTAKKTTISVVVKASDRKTYKASRAYAACK